MVHSSRSPGAKMSALWSIRQLLHVGIYVSAWRARTVPPGQYDDSYNMRPGDHALLRRPSGGDGDCYVCPLVGRAAAKPALVSSAWALLLARDSGLEMVRVAGPVLAPLDTDSPSRHLTRLEVRCITGKSGDFAGTVRKGNMMTRKERLEYNETLAHWRALIPQVGIERVREAYRDALFMAVPPHYLAALRDAARTGPAS